MVHQQSPSGQVGGPCGPPRLLSGPPRRLRSPYAKDQARRSLIALRPPRADHQVVATRPLTGIVEAVPHVSLEVQRIALVKHILITIQYRPQSPPLDDDVLLHSPAVRREL